MEVVLVSTGFFLFGLASGRYIKNQTGFFVALSLAAGILTLVALFNALAGVISLLVLGWVALSVVVARGAEARGYDFNESLVRALFISPFVSVLFDRFAKGGARPAPLPGELVSESSPQRAMQVLSPVPGYLFAAVLIGLPALTAVVAPAFFSSNQSGSVTGASSEPHDNGESSKSVRTPSGGVAEFSSPDVETSSIPSGQGLANPSKDSEKDLSEPSFRCAWAGEVVGAFGALRHIVCEDKSSPPASGSIFSDGEVSHLSELEVKRWTSKSTGCSVWSCALLIHRDDVVLASNRPFDFSRRFPEGDGQPLVLLLESTSGEGMSRDGSQYILDLTQKGRPVLLLVNDSSDYSGSILMPGSDLRQQGKNYEFHYAVQKVGEGPLGETVLQKFRYVLGYGQVEAVSEDVLYDTKALTDKQSPIDLLDDPEARRPLLNLLSTTELRRLRTAMEEPSKSSTEAGGMFKQLEENLYAGEGCDSFDCSYSSGAFVIDTRRAQAWVVMVDDGVVHSYGRRPDMSPVVRAWFDRWLDLNGFQRLTRVVHLDRG
jgi:hypothetical protein